MFGWLHGIISGEKSPPHRLYNAATLRNISILAENISKSNPWDGKETEMWFFGPILLRVERFCALFYRKGRLFEGVECIAGKDAL